MEKKKLTQKMIDGQESFEDLGFEIAEFLPYRDLIAAAEELSERTTLLSDSGAIYKSPYFNVVFVFVVLKYFTNIDMTDWDEFDSMISLVDFARKKLDNQSSRSKFVKAGSSAVLELSDGIFYSLYIDIENKNSLSSKIEELINSLTGEFDKDLSHLPDINQKMIDALDYLASDDRHEDKAKNLTMFAKK